MSFHSSRRRVSVALAVLVGAVALVVYTGVAQGSGQGTHDGNGRFTVGLFGDMPYNAQGRADDRNRLQDVNADPVAVPVFAGDLKAGGDGPCSDSLYTTSIANFNPLERPLIWVPGDNDWTDCWGRYGPGQRPFF